MAKPKAKTQEQKNAELKQLLADAAISNDMDQPAATPAVIEPLISLPPPTTAVNPASGIEQEGENSPVAPGPESSLPTTPTLELSLPTTPTLEPSRPMALAAKPELVSETVAVSDKEAVPGNNAPTEAFAELPTTAAGDDPGVGGGERVFDLESLFVSTSSEKKTAQMRISNAHYQYLLLLGTVVGAGTGVPEIIHNIVAQFIRKNDAQIQKAIQKTLRKNQAALRK